MSETAKKQPILEKMRNAMASNLEEQSALIHEIKAKIEQLIPPEALSDKEALSENPARDCFVTIYSENISKVNRHNSQLRSLLQILQNLV